MGEPNFLLEKGNNSEKGGGGKGVGGGWGVDVEVDCHFFYFFTVQLHLLYVCGKTKVSFIAFRFFSLLN